MRAPFWFATLWGRPLALKIGDCFSNPNHDILAVGILAVSASGLGGHFDVRDRKEGPTAMPPEKLKSNVKPGQPHPSKKKLSDSPDRYYDKSGKAKPAPKPTNYTDMEKNDILKRFFKAYLTCGTISGSAREAGVNHRAIKRWLKEEKYAEAFERIKEMFVDSLESEAVRRAMEKSDYLLGMLLKANRPEKFGDRHKIEGELNQQSTVKLVFSPAMLAPHEQKLLVGGDDDGEEDA